MANDVQCPPIEKTLDLLTSQFRYALTEDRLRLVASFQDLHTQTVAMMVGRFGGLHDPSVVDTLRIMLWGRYPSQVIDDLVCLAVADGETFMESVERIARTGSETARRVKRQMLRLGTDPFIIGNERRQTDAERLREALRSGYVPPTVTETTDEQRSQVERAIALLDTSLDALSDGA